jgi:hypothetical protein
MEDPVLLIDPPPEDDDTTNVCAWHMDMRFCMALQKHATICCKGSPWKKSFK